MSMPSPRVILEAFSRKLPFNRPPVATPAQLALKQLIAGTSPLRVILGAGPTQFPGWIGTDLDTLNITRLSQWRALFGHRRVETLLAEHVWEHLSPDEAAVANRLCFRFLGPGGRLRLAVPDGLHPAPAYREWVRPGGSGPGADDHRILYDYRTLTASLQEPGFKVRLLEYWDEHGQFYFTDWSSAEGHIARSKRYDPRNQERELAYTSLIVDAMKP
jgi:predicted SAM-dependent methyltransferase